MDNKHYLQGEVTSGENIPYWIDSVPPLSFQPLDNSLQTDVLVIGGGISGLSSAYCLLKKGKKVVVVEDGLIGSGETGRTTAHLTCALDDRYYEIEKSFGEAGARKAAESHTLAIDWIDKTVTEEGIDCDFERLNGYLFLHPSDDKKNLRKELEATQKAGIHTTWIEQVPGIPTVSGPCLMFPNQAQFHIMKYLQGLAKAIIRLGGTIYTNTRAADINEKGAKCNGHQVSASHIIVATNTPVNDFVAMHTKQFPYRTYVTAFKIPKNSLAHALWWDTGDQKSKWITAPYHYIRMQKYNDEFDLLLVGGEDHKTGQADDENIPEEKRYHALIEWTRKVFPSTMELAYHWSGQVIEPVDLMAFIGRNPGDENIYIITSDSGNGMTHGTIGGLIISDLIVGKENPWTELYSPSRLPFRKPGTYVSEVFNMAKQYTDLFTAPDIRDIGELANGEGAIYGKGMKKIAVYKDEQGVVHSYNAICPHLGCVLQWNADEKSFDCPCHGSRFTTEGIVINGPAVSSLKKISLESEQHADPQKK
jgi:glycine/D-amino acid oxidase-like deaminating enzyme/nitrite reductase/ring-hydroxylating ferredoxin subunit